MISHRKINRFTTLTSVLGVLLLAPGAAWANAISFSLLQTDLRAPAGGTVIFEGTITNNTGAALDAATDLFLNFQSFDPTALTPIQLLGVPDFILPSGATSGLVDLFSLTVGGALPIGAVSSIDVVLEDTNADLSSLVTATVTTTNTASIPEPGTRLLITMAMLALGLIRWRRRLFGTMLSLGILSGLILTPQAKAQQPSFSTQAPTTASSGGAFTVILPLANSGAASAGGVQVTFAGLTSAGIPISTLLRPTPLPVSIGALAGGAVQVLDLAFDNSHLIAGKPYLVTVRGTYSFNGATLGFSVNRPVVYSGSSPFGGPGTPLGVAPVLDTSHMATELIIAALGATLTTTGADGTVFTLTVPPNALLSDELITMTPVSSLGGIPVTGGLLAAAQIEPTGVVLVQPATLTIQPPALVPIANQVGFAYQGGGQDFSLSSLANTNTITLNLTHFSGHGVGSGSVPQALLPGQTLAQLENAIAPLLQQQRTCALTGAGCDPQFDSKLDGLEQLFFDQVVVPQLQQALTDYTVASSAIGTALAWLRQVVISNPADGLKEPFATDQQYIMQTIPIILTNAFNQIYGLCAATSDAPTRQSYAVQLLGIVRQLDIMFGGAINYLPNYQNQITVCAVGPLDLSFDSNATGSQVQPTLSATETSHVLAQAVHMTPDLAATYNASTAPLQYLSFNLTAPGFCAVITSTKPGTLDATGKFDLNLFLSPEPPTLVLTLRPKIQETVNYGEPLPTGCTLLGPAPTGFYEENLAVAHTPDTAASYRVPVNSSKSVTFSGTVSLGGAVATATETTTITLNQSN